MRVDHAGEVCAQALYAGQALMARDPAVRSALEKAGAEERDHLAWCAERLHELDSRPSLLSPLWYAGSFALGVVSGAAGDRWSMGFLVETERQVEKHIDGHLERLPPGDERSRAILEQMRADEIEHAESGLALGGEELPAPVRAAMRLVAKVMTETAYRF
jgi:ubiquinone biosynthesis monooxygenase Coq7